MAETTRYTGSLRPYQLEGTEWLEDHPKSILADEYGLGKTNQAIATIAKHLPALVIAPSYLCRQWFDALCEKLPEATISWPDGTRLQRALELTKPADVRVVGYPMLASYTFNPGDYQSVVCDEAHRIRKVKTTHSQAAKQLIWRVPRAHLLTATPYYKGDEDIWHLLHCLDPYTFRGYWDFLKEWYTVNWAANYTPKIYGLSKKKRPEFDKLIASYMLQRTYQDVGRQLPPLIEKVIQVDLNPDIRKHYQTLKKDWQLLGSPVESVGGVYYLLRQMTFSKPKLDAILDILDTIPNEQVLLFTQYKESAHTLHNTLKRGTKREIDALLLTGDTPPDVRAELLAEQKRTGHPRLVVATIDCLELGANLEHIRHVVWGEETYVKGKHNQALARALRDRGDDGSLEPVISYYVRARKTIDERIPIIRNSRGNASNRELAQELQRE